MSVDLDSLVEPDVATVTQLNKGMWFVHWTSPVPGSETFQCGATKLELISGLTFEYNQVTLSLKEAQGNDVSLCQSFELFTCCNVFTVTVCKFCRMTF